MPTPLRGFTKRFLSVACFVLVVSASTAFAQTSTITYQGRLSDNGTAANGTYDLQFKLYDAPTLGNLQGSPNTVTKTGVNVTNGIFTVQLDFGAGAFPGADRYLEISVQHNGGGFTALLPRQQLTSTPYAIRSSSAASADTATSATTATTATNNVLKSGDTMTGALVLSGDPAVALGAATKQYVDSGDALKLSLTGGTMSGVLNMGSNKITALATPTSGTDAANKSYVDAAIPTIANYAFAYDTTTQTPVVANVFQNITFSTNAQLNGWTYTAGTASFTCPQTGLYSIEYAAEGEVSNAHDIVSLRAALDGTEVAGSQAAIQVSDALTFVLVSKGFIASITAGDVLALQFAASRTTDELVAGVGQGTTRPSVSVTIIRIQ
jgi:hypothetical protein